MASSFATVKLNSRLVDAAREEAELFHRSLSGQIEHWATLGRALETAQGVSLDRVRAALAGGLKIEDLSEVEQDAFFANLGEAFDNPAPDLKAGYAALGRQTKAARRKSSGRKSSGRKSSGAKGRNAA